MNSDVFEQGRDALKASDYKAAVRDFQQALDSIDEHHEHYNRVVSYLGLSQVLASNRNGLLLCRDAASSEVLHGRVFLNLTCAEWHYGNRRRAIDAVQRGLKIDSAHAQLRHAAALLDTRKRSVFSFLPRSHKLNRLLGRFFRRPQQQLSVHGLLYNEQLESARQSL